ncbi:hypothetical protein K0038_02934 [Pseudomonas syringae]|uniref:hypothetical protein n=1 Tax=Pseudomonas syringae TaxID=317 RepID=UPI001FDA1004|nr:hypothetical protein [Pseudomonas syringae]MCI3945887.1 hypothetical protein [Pseudomonas syringae]
MSSIHEQAMNYVYQQVLQRVLGYFTRAERTALQLLIQRLIVAAGGIERISGFKVLVPFGGGKDSAYTLAFLRAAQLSIACRSPGTFSLRVANRRHAGMTPAVMDNIHRTYSALFLYDDPRVEMLVIDNQYTQAFEPDLPFSSAGREQNRLDMLLGGHLSAGDARTTFCNACYLGRAEFLGRALSWGTGVDAVGPEAPYGYLLCKNPDVQWQRYFLLRAFRLPPVRQRAIARLSGNGRLDAYLKALRDVLVMRMQAMTRQLDERLDGLLRYEVPEGGCGIWAESMHRVDMRQVCHTLLAKRIVMTPGELFSRQDTYGQHLRISYAIDWSEAPAILLTELAQALRSARLS